MEHREPLRARRSLGDGGSQPPVIAEQVITWFKAANVGPQRRRAGEPTANDVRQLVRMINVQREWVHRNRDSVKDKRTKIDLDTARVIQRSLRNLHIGF